jgi:hypothetical protein
MALTMNTERLGDSILAAIQAEIETVAAEEAEAAAERVKQRIRERIATIALAMQDHYSVERMGRDVVIRVKYEDHLQ